MSGQRNVLVIEDDKNVRRILRHHLEGAGFAVAEADSAEHAEHFLGEAALVLLDLVLAGKPGGAFVRELRAKGISTPVIVITGFDDPDLKTEANALGILFWLVKPVRKDELLDKVRRAFSATGVFLKLGGLSERIDGVLCKLAKVNGESYIPRTQ